MKTFYIKTTLGGSETGRKERYTMTRMIILASFVISAAAVIMAFGLMTPKGEAARYSIEGEAATPLGSAFTYQGHLLDSGVAPTASYDLQFTLFDQASAGIQIAGPITLDNVSVTDGIFTVQLDFGSAAFNGDNRFISIGIRPGASTGAFTSLTTRSQITAAPYALYAKTAGAAESLTSRCPLRKFYMTSSFPQGNAAINACVAGYHFASLQEIMDPSNLEYATELGSTAHSLPDSGSGPPLIMAGAGSGLKCGRCTRYGRVCIPAGCR